MTKEQRTEIEEVFKQRCISLNIKYKSKAFYSEQAAYFVGAMKALMVVGKITDFPDAYWSITILSGREIVEYKL